MKKIVFVSISMLTLVYVSFVSMSVNQKMDGISFFTEALADPETDGGSGTCKWHKTHCEKHPSFQFEACIVKGLGTVCTCGAVTRECNLGKHL